MNRSASSLDRVYCRRIVDTQPEHLVDDLSGGVQDRDDVGMGELAATVLIVDAKESGQLARISQAG
jgi:hypothetical protein